MTSRINALRVRLLLGKDDWAAPTAHGPDGWRYVHKSENASVIVSCAEHGTPPQEWVHASIARHDRIPDYADLVHLHHAVFGDGYAYQVFAPREFHVNIHQRALHLWGRYDGQPAIPEFGMILPGGMRSI